jgi:4-carboxymuconolactone decarboxylase
MRRVTAFYSLLCWASPLEERPFLGDNPDNPRGYIGWREGMARVPEIKTREELPEGQRGIYDQIAGSRGRVAGPFAVLMNSPELAGRVAHLGAYLRFGGVLPAADKEVLILATARELDCAYEWGAHVPLARKAGVREEAITAIAERRPLDVLRDDEALLVRYVRDIIQRHHVRDSTFAAVQAAYGIQGVTELAATVGYYALLAYVMNALAVEPEPGAPTLP